MAADQINRVLDEVRQYGGEAYDGHGCKGYRKPVRQDTENLLTALVMAARPDTILEFGTGYGVSTLCMARGYVGADIHTVEFDAEVLSKARRVFDVAGIGARMTFWQGSAIEAIEVIKRAPSKPDLVLFDHAMSQYLADIEDLCFACSGHPFLLLADNVIDHAAEIFGFLSWIARHASEWMIYPTECGLLVARIWRQA